MAAPVGNTCPLIDEVRDKIKSIARDTEIALDDFENLPPCELKKALKEIVDNLEDLSSKWSTLEDIRDANSKLREWGEDSESRIDELEGQIKELENQVNKTTLLI